MPTEPCIAMHITMGIIIMAIITIIMAMTAITNIRITSITTTSMAPELR